MDLSYYNGRNFVSPPLDPHFSPMTQTFLFLFVSLRDPILSRRLDPSFLIVNRPLLPFYAHRVPLIWGFGGFPVIARPSLLIHDSSSSCLWRPQPSSNEVRAPPPQFSDKFVQIVFLLSTTAFYERSLFPSSAPRTPHIFFWMRSPWFFVFYAKLLFRRQPHLVGRLSLYSIFDVPPLPPPPPPPPPPPLPVDRGCGGLSEGLADRFLARGPFHHLFFS